jgi:hypothetical protein
MKKLRYICAQPAIDYYAWQVEVMINNFKKNGINPNNIDIVCSINNGNIPDNWKTLQRHYNTVRFFFYNDERVNPCYISSIRPHILHKHFIEHPYLADEAIFYHDCDIVFTNPVNWNHLLEDDIWYLSDTQDYISADYIKSKGYGIYERMCEIVGIHQSIPEKYNDDSSGGAQYLMKNIDADFWKKVYDDSEHLYQFFLDHLKAFPEGCLNNYHPIQKWTADMWTVLWNAWYFGNETKIISEMSFTWPGRSIDEWGTHNILHNAGVTQERESEKLFFKGNYMNNLPYDIKLEDFSEERCSYKYVEEIIETAKVSCLI